MTFGGFGAASLEYGFDPIEGSRSAVTFVTASACDIS
jgi:hypothetical protein